VDESEHQWEEKEHFLSTKDFVSAHFMPPTFKYMKWGFGYRYIAFVEYVLSATVKEAKGTASVLLSTRKATLPLIVRSVANPELAAPTLPLGIEFRMPSCVAEKPRPEASSAEHSPLHTQTISYTMKSSKLLLWEREPRSGLQKRQNFSFSSTIHDRTKSMFTSSTLPRFTFKLSVSTPNTIRILNENGIPFVINAVPVRDEERTTIPPEQYPDIRIDNITLTVKALTYVRWKSMISDRSMCTSSEIKLLDCQPVNQSMMMDRKSRDRQSFVTTDEDTTTENPPVTEAGIDLSKIPSLVAVLKAYKARHHTERPLPPTFHSYIISREYELKWKLELDVAGEKVEIDSDASRPITVVDPHKEDLEAFAKTSAFLKGKQAEDASNDQSDEEAGEAETTTTAKSSSCNDTMNMLRRFTSRQKSREAAEEATAASRSSQDTALEYQPGGMLPQHEQGPTDFGYRNEIDDEQQPPRYETE